MKKIGVILILTLMLCSSFVAAGFWDIITGRQVAVPVRQLGVSGPQGQMAPAEFFAMLSTCHKTGSAAFCCVLPDRLIDRPIAQGIKLSSEDKAKAPVQSQPQAGGAQAQETDMQDGVAADINPEDVDKEVNLNPTFTGLAVVPAKKLGLFSRVFSKKESVTTPPASKVQAPSADSLWSFGQIKNMLSNCEFSKSQMCCAQGKITASTNAEDKSPSRINEGIVTDTQNEGKSPPQSLTANAVFGCEKALDLPKIEIKKGGIWDHNFMVLEQASVVVKEITNDKVKLDIKLEKYKQSTSGGQWVSTPPIKVELNKVQGEKVDVCGLFDITIAGLGKDYADLNIEYQKGPDRRAIYRLLSDQGLYKLDIQISNGQIVRLDRVYELADDYAAGRGYRTPIWGAKIEPSGVVEHVNVRYMDSLHFAKCIDTCDIQHHDETRQGLLRGEAYVRIKPEFSVRFAKDKEAYVVLKGFEIVSSGQGVKYRFFDNGYGIVSGQKNIGEEYITTSGNTYLASKKFKRESKGTFFDSGVAKILEIGSFEYEISIKA